MTTEKEDTKISKFLSLVLRHQPQLIGIELDSNGWTNTEILLLKAKEAKIYLDIEKLKNLVENNPKKRFAFSENFEKIRANQGHSVEIELGYESKNPPEILYHGTSKNVLESILKTGIERKKRHHVHLSQDIETATKVGKRHGEVVILEVLAGQMEKDNFEFYLSENGVWLTDFVPTKYLNLKNS
jgi:putative RNA 2'-phosphotransferase